MPIIKDKQRRIDICQECKHYAYGICRICYCIVAVKTKLENAMCPEGKW
jgi:hypothetical protein